MVGVSIEGGGRDQHDMVRVWQEKKKERDKRWDSEKGLEKAMTSNDKSRNGRNGKPRVMEKRKARVAKCDYFSHGR